MMTLPCHNDLSSEDINKIVTAVKVFMVKADAGIGNH